MTLPIYVLGDVIMDCVAQEDGTLKPFMGGSCFSMARAAALRGASVQFLNPLSVDSFGMQMDKQFKFDGVLQTLPASSLPTALAVVQVNMGQPSYSFYREAVADRDYDAAQVVRALSQVAPGVLHTGSLMLVPPESSKVLAVLQAAKRLGWTISVDVNLRPKLANDLSQYIAAVQEITSLADWLKASDEDLELLGFDAPTRTKAPVIAQQFLAQGTSRVALTFGAKGAWLSVDGREAQAHVPPVEVVDTVGAGDTFWGNCLADWTLQPQNVGARVASTLQLAMAAAALNCTRAGCQPPHAAELR
jgi:fructokinase